MHTFISLCPGTFAVISLILSEAISRICEQVTEQQKSELGNQSMTKHVGALVPVCFPPDSSLSSSGANSGQFDLRPQIAITLTFLIGMIQVSRTFFLRLFVVNASSKIFHSRCVCWDFRGLVHCLDTDHYYRHMKIKTLLFSPSSECCYHRD